MHRCAATCCDNRESSLERVQKCVENCSAPLNWAQNYVQEELGSLQNKLQRCVMNCNDDVRVQLGANPSDSEVTFESAFNLRPALKLVISGRKVYKNLREMRHRLCGFSSEIYTGVAEKDEERPS